MKIIPLNFPKKKAVDYVYDNRHISKESVPFKEIPIDIICQLIALSERKRVCDLQNYEIMNFSISVVG